MCGSSASLGYGRAGSSYAIFLASWLFDRNEFVPDLFLGTDTSVVNIAPPHKSQVAAALSLGAAHFSVCPGGTFENSPGSSGAKLRQERHVYSKRASNAFQAPSGAA